MKTIKFIILLPIVSGICFFNLWSIAFNPKQSMSFDTEAVVIFAGGSGERFDFGLNLIKTHKIRYLLLSIGAIEWIDRERLKEHCSTEHDSHIVSCIQTSVDDDNTLGEAKLFAENLEKLGLNRVVVVSGKSHVYRASLSLSQCFPGKVDRMGTEDLQTSELLAREWLGIVQLRLASLIGCHHW